MLGSIANNVTSLLASGANLMLAFVNICNN
jgi:hypothetical protein